MVWSKNRSNVVVIDVKVKILRQLATGFGVIKSKAGEVGLGLTQRFCIAFERRLQTEFQTLAFDENALAELFAANTGRVNIKLK